MSDYDHLKSKFFEKIQEMIEDDDEPAKNQSAPDEKDKKKEPDEEDFDMYFFDDGHFQNKQALFEQLKIKVVAELLFKFRTETKVHVPSETVATWMEDYALKHNLEKEEKDCFELCVKVTTLRNKIDKFLKIRKERSKSLILREIFETLVFAKYMSFK